MCCSINCLSCFIDLFILMRASLSKSDNALSSITSVINCRFKRHHSIDDDYPVTSSSASSSPLLSSSSPADEKKIHVHFHPDVITSDHRVPLSNDNKHQIELQKSSFSSELVVSRDKDMIIIYIMKHVCFRYLYRKSSNGLIILTNDKKKRYFEN